MHVAQAVPCIQSIILLAKGKGAHAMNKDPGNAPYRDERGLGKPLMIDKAAAAEEQHAAY
jgi:hypothetical protein